MRKVSDLEEVMKAAVKSPNQVLFLTVCSHPVNADLRCRSYSRVIYKIR